MRVAESCSCLTLERQGSKVFPCPNPAVEFWRKRLESEDFIFGRCQLHRFEPIARFSSDWSIDGSETCLRISYEEYVVLKVMEE